MDFGTWDPQFSDVLPDSGHARWLLLSWCTVISAREMTQYRVNHEIYLNNTFCLLDLSTQYHRHPSLESWLKLSTCPGWRTSWTFKKTCKPTNSSNERISPPCCFLHKPGFCSSTPTGWKIWIQRMAQTRVLFKCVLLYCKVFMNVPVHASKFSTPWASAPMMESYMKKSCSRK